MATEMQIRENIQKYAPYIKSIKSKYKKHQFYDEKEIESWAHQGIVAALDKIDKSKNESSFVMAHINNYVLLGLRFTGNMMGKKGSGDFFKSETRDLNNTIVSLDNDNYRNSGNLNYNETIPSGEPSPYDILEQQDSIDYLHDAIESLSEEEQFLIKERFFNGLTYRELAEKLDCSKVLVQLKIKTITEKMKYLIINKI